MVIAAVCVTRVTLHTHSIADAAAGVALGLAFVALFDRAVRTQARRAEASPVGLMAVIVVIATLAVASGLRISSTHFL